MSSWSGDLLRGAIAGGVAVWIMDLVTTGFQSSQSPASLAREKAAAVDGQSSLTNLVNRVAHGVGVDLDTATRSQAVQVVHYALGVVPGALYGAMRGRIPIVGAGRGVLYGASIWAGNDEVLNAKLGLSGPIEAYPWETHVRGLVGHLVLGMVTDAGIDVLGGG